MISLKNNLSSFSPTTNVLPSFQYYQAFFEAFREEAWLEGTFWWWWDNPSTSDYVHGGEDYPYYYTPQGKPAEAILRAYYQAPIPPDSPLIA